MPMLFTWLGMRDAKITFPAHITFETSAVTRLLEEVKVFIEPNDGASVERPYKSMGL